jgi:hypothetical protein
MDEDRMTREAEVLQDVERSLTREFTEHCLPIFKRHNVSREDATVILALFHAECLRSMLCFALTGGCPREIVLDILVALVTKVAAHLPSDQRNAFLSSMERPQLN